jgi:hypothetical protein
MELLLGGAVAGMLALVQEEARSFESLLQKAPFQGAWHWCPACPVLVRVPCHRMAEHMEARHHAPLRSRVVEQVVREKSAMLTDCTRRMERLKDEYGRLALVLSGEEAARRVLQEEQRGSVLAATLAIRQQISDRRMVERGDCVLGGADSDSSSRPLTPRQQRTPRRRTGTPTTLDSPVGSKRVRHDPAGPHTPVRSPVDVAQRSPVDVSLFAQLALFEEEQPRARPAPPPPGVGGLGFLGGAPLQQSGNGAGLQR